MCHIAVSYTHLIRFWLLRFRKLDMSLKDQRQALVDTFINAIYLYDALPGAALFLR